MSKIDAVAIIAFTFIWVGLLCGISFLEVPLKFQAPGITLELGLGIGKLVFGALTKIEIAFSLVITGLLLIKKQESKTLIWYGIPILIVIIDNAFLMPILDIRIDLITSGETPPESNVHLYYVILEAIKLLSLLIGGISYTNSAVQEPKP